VPTDTNIALDCPYCGESIYEALSWFKKTYSTCPNCDRGLAASQFSAVISDLEKSMEESIEEMVLGQQQGGSCCGKKSSCGCH
jgi:hypothetical protein